MIFNRFFYTKKSVVSTTYRSFSLRYLDANFWIHLERILFCEYFILASSNSVPIFPVYLLNRRLRVCIPATSYISTRSLRYYLSPSGFDWIFSRGRNVSTKWIRRNIAFRQARSNFSFNKREPLSLSSLPPSHLFVVADRPFLALPFFFPRSSTVP